jgi:hypothetical protein
VYVPTFGCLSILRFTGPSSIHGTVADLHGGLFVGVTIGSSDGQQSHSDSIGAPTA